MIFSLRDKFRSALGTREKTCHSIYCHIRVFSALLDPLPAQAGRFGARAEERPGPDARADQGGAGGGDAAGALQPAPRGGPSIRGGDEVRVRHVMAIFTLYIVI